MKPEQVYKLRQRLVYTSRDGVVTIAHAALAELQRRMAMSKEECDAEDEMLNTWLRYESRYG